MKMFASFILAFFLLIGKGNCLESKIYADYLYWKVCRTDLDYTNESGDTYFIDPHFDSGWRIGGLVQKCRLNLEARYTSFNTSETDNTIFFSSDWDIVDITAGYTLLENTDFALLRPFAGAKLAWISEKKNVDSTNDKLSFNGYGLSAGLEGRFLLYEGRVCQKSFPLCIVGRGCISVLDSTFRQTLFDETAAPQTRRFHKQCVYVPVLEIFAGLDIGGLECYRLTPHLLVGYEVQSWLSKKFAGSSQTAFLGIGGLTVRFALCF